MLGEMKVSLGGKMPSGSRWFNLQPIPSGEVFLVWDYEYTPLPSKADPLEQSLLQQAASGTPPSTAGTTVGDKDENATLQGKMTMEVIRLKDMVEKDFGEGIDPLVTFRVISQNPAFVTPADLHDVDLKTKERKATYAPHFNETWQLEFRRDPVIIGEPRPGYLDHILTFRVHNMAITNDSGVGELYAVGAVSLDDFSKSSSASKGLQLYRPPGTMTWDLWDPEFFTELLVDPSIIEEQQLAPMGNVLLKWKYIAVKRSKVKAEEAEEAAANDTCDPMKPIVLDYVPKVTGATDLIPPQRLYAWANILGDRFYRHEIEHALLNAYLVEPQVDEKKLKQQNVELPEPFPRYHSIDALVETEWKCERRHQLFCKMRIAAERMARNRTGQQKYAKLVEGGNHSAAPPEDLPLVVDREVEYAMKKEYHIQMLLRSEIAYSYKVSHKLQRMLYKYVLGEEDPSSEVLNSGPAPHSRFNKKLHQQLLSTIYLGFCPGMTLRVAKKIARNDWAADEKEFNALPPEQMQAEGSLFNWLMRQIALYWIETLTEYELIFLLEHLHAIVDRARMALLKTQKKKDDDGPADTEDGSSPPGKGKRKGSAKKKSGRKK
eukprot:NODE_355_length_2179_cov_35.164789_g283_i0.p1 GENE.NODE_355_length_2179_cov_35.164789_g283_i0~~NODE_355_length_2179_cov_35.164789_g283_i0.p1  ORF type:complete len:708 (+),score=209.41 NODE_355_length_2179_cov_35.164789_g283_i0:314-2125(+)